VSDEILTTTEDHVCRVTLNRPAKRNALTTGMIETLRASLERVAAEDDVRVVVVRAEGNVFCAGLDLAELAAQRASGEARTDTLELALHVLERLPLPTIAAVQGDAIAGGCELTLHCDLRVASESARFAMPVARLGLAVPVTLNWKLVDTIGAAATKELLFTGEPVGAATALALGMVNRVVAAGDLDRDVGELARQIAHNAPLSLRAMKASIQRLADFRRTIDRSDLEDMVQGVRASADLQEGLAAQRERRPPLFRGK
jgi:enoyl-CoA hydratase/carnithine racemase